MHKLLTNNGTGTEEGRERDVPTSNSSSSCCTSAIVTQNAGSFRLTGDMASSAYHAIFFCTHLAMTRAAGDVLVLPAAAGSAATRGRGRDVDIMWEGHRWRWRQKVQYKNEVQN